MFLNYSALESGKLVLHLHDNDIRDCVTELTGRWHEAFQRKQVRLEVRTTAQLPIFRFDYQKVQQAMANCLDNALKHTPAGGCVTLVTEAAFLGTPRTGEPATQERRRLNLSSPNSVKISVSDTGRGVAAEYHQEIFEDSYAWTGPPPAWAWAWPSRSGWYTRIAAKSRWIANWGEGRDSQSCFR